MGRLDAFDVGERKLTVQTEFFHKPHWRIETKIYVAGALKKLHDVDLTDCPEEELQRRIDNFHVSCVDELREKLMKLQK